MKKKSAGLFLLLMMFVSLLHAQQTSVKTLAEYISNINQFYNLNPQEKVYLHFDNTGYYLGDTIWFKGYTVFAGNIHPTSLSKILHVELLTPEGEKIDSRRLKIANGQCHGEFALDKDYSSGFYEIRAYTRSMLNFGDNCIFSRVFPVYDEPGIDGDYSEKTMENSYTKYKRKKKEKLKRVNLSFYPEGGNAIIGVRSKIAFRATGEKGQDIPVTGTVYNQWNEAVAKLSSTHQGMGYFELVPETPEYKVIVEYEGKKHIFPFKEIMPSGYALRVNNQDEETLLIQLQKSPSLPSDTVGVSLSCRGKVYVFEVIPMADEPHMLHLSKGELPQGCLQITVFDRQAFIHAERLVFNNRKEYLPIQVKQDKKNYLPFEKVDMEFSIKDKNGHPVETSFSLAIRDAETEFHTGYQDNILTDLLLSSDVKGYIENPIQYFERDDRATRMKLDLLMMVQGWRRYNWQHMAGVIPFEAGHYAEEGLPVTGKVLSSSGKKVEPDVDILIWMMKGGKSFRGMAKTDENGRFYFLLPDSAHIENDWLLGIQASENQQRKDYQITLDRLFSPQGRRYGFYDTNVKDTVILFEDEDRDSLYQRSIEDVQILPDVIVKAKRKRGKLRPDIILNVEKDINELADRGQSYPKTIQEYLERNVPVLDMNRWTFKNKPIYLCYSYKRKKTAGSINSISDIDIINVYRVHIYHKNKYAWTEVATGPCRNRGIGKPAVFVSVKLYDDGLRDEYQKGIRYTRFEGYSQVREFYHTNNSDKILGDVDFRRTLYWNPDVKTDKEGKSVISFYNNSTCRGITVSAEGLTIEGIPMILDNKGKKQ